MSNEGFVQFVFIESEWWLIHIYSVVFSGARIKQLSSWYEWFSFMHC